MCGGPPAPMLRCMKTESAAISLELDVAGDSLSGRASDGAGVEREFSGWLGLIAAIEALLANDSEGDRP